MAKLFRILAVTNALAMALPLGWCCPSPVEAVEREAASSAPCPHCQPQQTSNNESAPAAPDSPEKCPCCQVRATQPSAQMLTAPAAEAWTAQTAAIVSDSPSAREIEPTRFIHPPGPSIQVLLCVWRC